MLDEPQVQDIANDLSERLKRDKPLSDYNEQCVAQWNQVKVHSEESFPDQLIKKKHPNETDEEFQYRKDTWQAVSSSYWSKALQSINRIWQSFTVEWDKDEHREYFETQYPVYTSLQSFFESVATAQKINDPNTVLAVKPFVIPTKEIDGQIVGNDSEFIQPISAMFDCERVVDYIEDSYFIGISKEKSDVTFGGRVENVGIIFEIWDDMNIWRLTQVGKKTEYNFSISIYYPHGLKYLPVWNLKGKPIYSGDRIVYKSYFSPAIPLLNTAVVNNSTLDGSISRHAYPQRAYIEEDCDQCDDGYIHEAGKEKVSCEACGGRGKKTFSPFTDYVQYRNPRFDSDNNIPFPGVEYITPPMDPMIFLDSKINNDMISAFSIINIDVRTKSDTSFDKTATESVIDKEDFFSFLLNISSETSQVFRSIVNAIGEMRFVDWVPPKINVPDEFTIRSSQDLTNELKVAQEANMPDAALDKLNLEYMKRRFHDDETSEKRHRLRVAADSLRNKTDQEVTVITNTSLPKWKAVLHYEFDNYVDEFIKENKNFLDSKDAKSKLEERAKADAPTQPTIRERLQVA